MKRTVISHLLEWGVVGSLLMGIAPLAQAQQGSLLPDGKYNISDATLSLQIAVNLVTPTQAQIDRYDFSPSPGTGGRLIGDGRITISDVVAVLQLAIGAITLDTPPLQTQLFTLNGGAGFSVPGSASLVSLPQIRAGNLAGAITVNAFPTGSVPNHLVIAGEEGFVVNSTSHSLEFVNLSTLKDDGFPLFLGTSDQQGPGAAPNPWQVAVVGNKAYVSLQSTNDVAVVDIAGRKILSRIPVGPAPEGIVALGDRVYVVNTAFSFDLVKQMSVWGQGSLSMIDTATDQVVGTMNLPTNPTYIRADYAGRLHVACTGNYADIPGVMVLLQPRAGQLPDSLGTIPVGGAPGPMAFAPNGLAYVANGNGGVMKYDPNQLKVLIGADKGISLNSPGVTTNPGPVDLVADYAGNIYAALFIQDRVDVINFQTDQLALEIPVGHGPEAITLR